MLWRALGYLESGFYIDIGAQHPVNDSVSMAFYEKGWRGVHVEPVRKYAELLAANRPDEAVLKVLISESPGSATFYEVEDTGLSTARRDIALEHMSNGFSVREYQVECMTLDQVFEQIGKREIQWLKIDVEGYEKQVLRGWKLSRIRPWIVVVEATYPNTQIDTFDEWEHLILEKNYVLVYLDGLNRFYLHKSRLELKPAFVYPPNVFDRFTKWSGEKVSDQVKPN